MPASTRNDPRSGLLRHGPGDAEAALAAARGKAASAGRRMAVVFGADWCPDSRAFDAALAHPLVAPLVDDGFEIVHLDVGRAPGKRDAQAELMATWDLDPWRGIPTVAFLDPAPTEDAPRLLHALRDGELASARTLAPLDFVEIFHPWSPRPSTSEAPP